MSDISRDAITPQMTSFPEGSHTSKLELSSIKSRIEQLEHYVGPSHQGIQPLAASRLEEIHASRAGRADRESKTPSVPFDIEATTPATGREDHIEPLIMAANDRHVSIYAQLDLLSQSLQKCEIKGLKKASERYQTAVAFLESFGEDADLQGLLLEKEQKTQLVLASAAEIQQTAKEFQELENFAQYLESDPIPDIAIFKRHLDALEAATSEPMASRAEFHDALLSLSKAYYTTVISLSEQFLKWHHQISQLEVQVGLR